MEFEGKKVFAGGENSIAVFSINQSTGEPTLIQNIDGRGTTLRTFALDPSGRMLVAASQSALFDDLDVILPGFPGPSPEMLEKMYGRRIER